MGKALGWRFEALGVVLAAGSRGRVPRTQELPKGATSNLGPKSDRKERPCSSDN